MAQAVPTPETALPLLPQICSHTGLAPQVVRPLQQPLWSCRDLFVLQCSHFGCTPHPITVWGGPIAHHLSFTIDCVPHSSGWFTEGECSPASPAVRGTLPTGASPSHAPPRPTPTLLHSTRPQSTAHVHSPRHMSTVHGTWPRSSMAHAHSPRHTPTVHGFY